jgi:hypothetical protein|tara:strand:+ start:62 stop:355 length:294 start_codon:yes stop_codon:yes gene_type:complete
MSSKKKKGTKRIKVIEYRTLENRKNEVKELIKELTKFELNMKYEPVQKLYKEFKKYIDTGERIIINIPFPMINRRIKGILSNTVNEKVTIALKHEKF